MLRTWICSILLCCPTSLDSLYIFFKPEPEKRTMKHHMFNIKYVKEWIGPGNVALSSLVQKKLLEHIIPSREDYATLERQREKNTRVLHICCMAFFSIIVLKRSSLACLHPFLISVPFLQANSYLNWGFWKLISQFNQDCSAFSCERCLLVSKLLDGSFCSRVKLTSTYNTEN